MDGKKRNGIVRGFFERVSWQVLDKYRPIVKQMIRGRAANDWHFWTYRKDKEWVRLAELRG